MKKIIISGLGLVLIGSALAATTAPASAGLVPATTSTNTVKPRILGDVRVGATLLGTQGSWKHSRFTRVQYTLEWLRNGVPIPGENTRRLELQGSDLGAVIQLRVTATAAGDEGGSVALSNSTHPVLPGIPRAGFPRITGTNKVGEILTIHPGDWKPDDLIFRYTWYADGEEIWGEQFSAFPWFWLGCAEAGKRITVRVRAFHSADPQDIPFPTDDGTYVETVRHAIKRGVVQGSCEPI